MDTDQCTSQCRSTLGLIRSNPAPSCAAVASDVSGVYYLHPGPGGGEDLSAYCDQERDGGGWILIGAVNPATTDGLQERATWFQTGSWPWTALTNEFNTNGVLVGV